MGRFAYWMNVSLDLRIEQVPGDNGAGEWLRISEELYREFNARARALALMVQGRVIYETMQELLCTHPAILGFGRPLFDDYDVPIELDLLEQRSFEQGVTMHRYAIRDVSEASPC